MKFRKLRIAWSVAWGIAAVLLIALWVRSYTVIDSPYCSLTQKWTLAFHSFWGCLHLHVNDRLRTMPLYAPSWAWPTPTIEEYFRDRRQPIPPAAWPLDFRFTTNVVSWNLKSPIWFWMAVCSVMAWLPLRKANWRFSLRTLLIATTLVAVVLGLAVYAV